MISLNNEFSTFHITKGCTRPNNVFLLFNWLLWGASFPLTKAKSIHSADTPDTLPCPAAHVTPEGTLWRSWLYTGQKLHTKAARSITKQSSCFMFTSFTFPTCLKKTPEFVCSRIFFKYPSSKTVLDKFDKWNGKNKRHEDYSVVLFCLHNWFLKTSKIYWLIYML